MAKLYDPSQGNAVANFDRTLPAPHSDPSQYLQTDKDANQNFYPLPKYGPVDLPPKSAYR